MENETIIFDTPDGQVEVNVVAVYEIEDKSYIAVVPTALMNKGEPEILVYRYTEVEDGIELMDISDEEFEQAREALEAILEEEDTEEKNDTLPS